MATKGGGSSEPLQYKTWVLKVSIHCEGCKKKVKRILQNVHGVYTIEIDSQKNKVTVIGDVEAETLIRKLQKSGKHAELLPIEKKPSNQNRNSDPNINGGKGKNDEKGNDASKPNEVAENSAATKGEPEKEQAKPNTKAESESLESEEASKPDPKSETQTKPTDNDTANKNGSNSKKKGKKVVEEEEATSNEGNLVMSSGGVQPMHQVPVYPQPVYATSYNMMQPTASYSYCTPTPEVPQSYTYGSNPSVDYYPNYSHENFYGSVVSSSSGNQGSYDFFSEENANACSVM